MPLLLELVARWRVTYQMEVLDAGVGLEVVGAVGMEALNAVAPKCWLSSNCTVEGWGVALNADPWATS